MEEIRCPSCHLFVDEKYNYCPKCGYNIRSLLSNGEKLLKEGQKSEEKGEYRDAAVYYVRGAQANNAEAMFLLGRLYERGKGVKRNPNKMLYCYKKAAELLYMPSIRRLYEIYAGKTEGIERNETEMTVYLQFLAEKGDEEAQKEWKKIGNEKNVLERNEIIDEKNNFDGIKNSGKEENFNFKPFDIKSANGKISKYVFSPPKIKKQNSQEEAFNEEVKHLKEVREIIKAAAIGADSASVQARPKFSCYDKEDLRQFRLDMERCITEEEKRDFLLSHLDEPYFGMIRIDFEDDIEDIYVGKDIIYIGNTFLVYSYNTEIGNKIYERITGKLNIKGRTYQVLYRRRFIIEKGVLKKLFQDYTYKDYNDSQMDEKKNIVYDEFLAEILEKKRGDSRLTDIIPSIQANQNYIITRPAFENFIVQGCAGSGKTMILLQRLEYLAFNRKINLKKVKVLVPNEEFKKHILPVCRDLRVTDATYLTIEEYYKEKLEIYLPSEKRKSIFEKKVLTDREYEDYARYYYSNEFYEKVQETVRLKKEEWEKRKETSSDKMTISLDGVGASIRKKRSDKETILHSELYATLLMNFCVYGAMKAPDKEYDSILYIDEGQDISLAEYKLFKAINDGHLIMNIFGDTNQLIERESGIGKWENLSEVGNFSEYSLCENYRNTQEITDFINKKLLCNITALGLNGNKVMEISFEEIGDLISCERVRIALIVQRSNTQAIQAISADSSLAPYLYFLEDCKGLEFEKVFVFDKDMSRNEKYIAYSRALSALYLVNI